MLKIKIEGGGLIYETEIEVAEGMRILGEILQSDPTPISAGKKTRGTKKTKAAGYPRKQSRASKDLGDEIAEHHKGRHPETEKIENLLMQGMTVKEITSTIKVSDPTIYVIKNRLKKEGKIQ